MKYYSIILTIHIICGFGALIGGLFPMYAKKGSKLHVQTGWIYFWSMFGVFITTIVMFMLKRTDMLLFLLLIGIFSFYLTFAGVRAVKLKKKGSKPALIDWIVSIFVFCCGSGMVGLAGFTWYTGSEIGLAILYLFFGLLTALQARDSLRSFNTLRLGLEPAVHWMYLHFAKMGGAYIATTTAFLVVNNRYLPSLVVWIGPGLIGGLILNRFAKRFFTADRRGLVKRKG